MAGKRSHADGIPCARRVIIGDGGVQCQPGARGDFIGHGHGAQGVWAGQFGVALGQRKERGNNRAADMALRFHQAVMAIEIIDLRGQGPGGAGLADNTGIKEHGRAVAGRREVKVGGIVAGDMADLKPRGPGGDAERVDQQRRRVAQGIVGDRKGRIEREIGDPGELGAAGCGHRVEMPVHAWTLSKRRPNC